MCVLLNGFKAQSSMVLTRASRCGRIPDDSFQELTFQGLWVYYSLVSARVLILTCNTYVGQCMSRLLRTVTSRNRLWKLVLLFLTCCIDHSCTSLCGSMGAYWTDLEELGSDCYGDFRGWCRGPEEALNGVGVQCRG